MTLYKYYEDGQNRVFACCVKDNLHFFYEGFEDKETAYNAVLNLLINRGKYNHPKRSLSMLREEAETRLEGEWSEIH